MTEMIERYETASKLISYDPDTGSMKWLSRSGGPDCARWNARCANRECGKINHNGYRIIAFRMGAKTQCMVLAHRLAWFMSYGVTPAGEIDHINQNRSDNRLINLRDVSRSMNHRNRTLGSNNTSGAVGVTWNKRVAKWQAQVTLFTKNHHLGLFSTLPEAEAVVRKFRLENGFTEMHGRPTP